MIRSCREPPIRAWIWRGGALPVAAALLALACAEVRPRSEGAGPATNAALDPLFELVPVGVESVVLVDVAGLRASSWTRPVLDALPAEERAARVAARGFDEARDVDRAILAGAGGGQDLLLATGRLDHGRLERAFHDTHPDAAAVAYRDREIVAAEGVALATVRPGVMAIGALALVRGALDRASDGGGDTSADPDGFTALLARLPAPAARAGEPVTGPRRPVVWLAVRVTDRLREGLGPGLAAHGDLRAVAARVDLSDSLSIRGVLQCRGARRAADLAGLVRTRLAELQDRPSVAALGFAPALAGAHVVADGDRVWIELRLEPRDRDDIAARLAVLARVLAERGKSGRGDDPAP